MKNSRLMLLIASGILVVLGGLECVFGAPIAGGFTVAAGLIGFISVIAGVE